MRKSDSGVVMRMSVGRAGEGAALVGRGVARADADADVGRRQLEPGRGVADADERGAQVALDVDGERLHRRDVEDPAAREPLLGHRLARHPVDGPEEGRQRLARAGRGDDDAVVARADRVPRPRLGGRGRAEAAPEPLGGRRRESVEHVGPLALRHRAQPATPHRHPPARHRRGPACDCGSRSLASRVGSAGDLAVRAVEAARPAPTVEVLEQRDDDAAGAVQGLAGVAGGERLGQRRELAHGERRRVRQQDDVTGQPEDAAVALGGCELARPESGGVELVLLRRRERAAAAGAPRSCSGRPRPRSRGPRRGPGARPDRRGPRAPPRRRGRPRGPGPARPRRLGPPPAPAPGRSGAESARRCTAACSRRAAACHASSSTSQAPRRVTVAAGRSPGGTAIPSDAASACVIQPRRATSRARSGTPSRPRTTSARRAAEPRRSSTGGSASTTTAPTTRRDPGSRRRMRSPPTTGSGAGRARRTAPGPSGRTRASTARVPRWTMTCDGSGSGVGGVVLLATGGRRAVRRASSSRARREASAARRREPPRRRRPRAG